MGNITETLIKRAAAVANPRQVGDRLVGDVGCALVTDQGNIYVGVCLDTASGTGFCAEASAIAAMVTAGEFRISQIVAVWKDEQGRMFVLSVLATWDIRSKTSRERTLWKTLPVMWISKKRSEWWPSSAHCMDYGHRDSVHPHRVTSLQTLEKCLNYRVTMRVNRVMMIVIHTTES